MCIRDRDMRVSPSEISQSFQDIMVNRGTCKLQNKDSHFPEDEAGQSLNKYWFDKTLQNDEKVNHTWMCFSPTKKSLFSFCCTLFPQKKKLSKKPFQ